MTPQPSVPSVLVVFNAHGYGGTELVFLRTCSYFAAREWRVSVIGRGVKELFDKYWKHEGKPAIDFAPAGEFDYLICSGIGIGLVEEIVAQGIDAAQCIVWAFGEAGLLENLACGYGLRLRFNLRSQRAFVLVYTLFLGWHIQAVRRFVCTLVEQGGLYFSDSIGFAETTGLPWVENPNIACVMPIPVPLARNGTEQNLGFPPPGVKNGLLRLGWVGRISKDFKIHPLLVTIDRAVKYCAERNLTLQFTIIGTGDAMAMLQRYTLGLKCDMRLKGFLPADEALVVIQRDVDIMIGMGTAALDAACAGVASLVVNPAMSAESAARSTYRWVFQSKGFSLGEFVEFGYADFQPSRTLECCFDEFGRAPEEIVAKCSQYVLNFDDRAVFRSLSTALSMSRMCLADLATGVSRTSTLRKRLYSLARRIRVSRK